MKKRIATCVLALCLSASLAAGCGKGEDAPVTTPAATSGQEETKAQTSSGAGFHFELKGASIAPGMSQDDLLAALGDADKAFEAPSCAGQGTDYTYTYGSVEITTVPGASGANEVSAIVLKDDLVSTPEGISLYMSAEEMTKAYGDGYTVSGSAYTYVKGNVQLQFVIEKDEITSIQYMIVE